MLTHIQEPQLIAVVTGGHSSERERSFLSGRAVHDSLLRQGYQTVFLDAAAPDFVDEVRRADVAFLAIAGQGAEDGKLQGLLESLNIPYTGSPVAASAVGMHKTLAKTVVAATGVKVLPHVEIPPLQMPDVVAKTLAETLAFPVILKPRSEGGSIGMSLCHNLTELIEAITAIDRAQAWFVEPFIPGTPATCAVLETGGSTIALPVLERVPTAAEFYDYAAKRDDTLHRYRCPARLTPDVTTLVIESALAAHRALGASGYSRSDFIVSPEGRVTWLEVNTLPGLSHPGNLATMADAAGISYDHLIRMILDTAHTSGGYRP
ncbi:D-alanine--D-alanine ligase [Streptomyces sp. H27-H1]|uniref:D-alanine--D-alanine ligase family protein n=1 Tax=Streptomyces sp. H27-H1 TaxID=2996461 RepID=UPI002271B9BB|nr:D-alanine--D-alanine ligase [Streptomyces sp. H27-H1]MCY0930983.1 D-alanine--D-alanine ligase [Streptomyces sp. H27-H1]